MSGSKFDAQEMLAGGGEIEPEDEDLFYLRRLEGGLFTLQTVDYILAWVVMEDDGVSGGFRTTQGN
jgi:beta-catenin-like protein 1